MSYNILCGGQPINHNPHRLDDILSVIRHNEPDILALQEANRFDENGLIDRVSSKLELAHHALAKGALYEDNEHYNVVIFSRYPIIRTHDFPEGDFQSAALSAEINTPFELLSVCNVHLHSYVETERVKELEDILKYQQRYDSQIILGDFNAISRKDSYADQNAEFELAYDVTDRMNEQYVDIFTIKGEADRHTFPTDGVSDSGFILSRRIDYMFASENLANRLTNASVDRKRLTHRASDHFPIIAEFIE